MVVVVVVVEKINAAVSPASTRQGVGKPNKEDDLLLWRNSQIVAEIDFTGAARIRFGQQQAEYDTTLRSERRTATNQGRLSADL